MPFLLSTTFVRVTTFASELLAPVALPERVLDGEDDILGAGTAELEVELLTLLSALFDIELSLAALSVIELSDIALPASLLVALSVIALSLIALFEASFDIELSDVALFDVSLEASFATLFDESEVVFDVEFIVVDVLSTLLSSLRCVSA